MPQNVPELRADPCWPERYYEMAAEIQITNPIAQWWRSDEFEEWRGMTILNDCSECIMDAYLVTNIGITRTYMYVEWHLHIMFIMYFRVDLSH